MRVLDSQPVRFRTIDADHAALVRMASAGLAYQFAESELGLHRVELRLVEVADDFPPSITWATAYGPVECDARLLTVLSGISVPEGQSTAIVQRSLRHAEVLLASESIDLFGSAALSASTVGPSSPERVEACLTWFRVDALQIPLSFRVRGSRRTFLQWLSQERWRPLPPEWSPLLLACCVHAAVCAPDMRLRRSELGEIAPGAALLLPYLVGEPIPMSVDLGHRLRLTFLWRAETGELTFHTWSHMPPPESFDQREISDSHASRQEHLSETVGIVPVEDIPIPITCIVGRIALPFREVARLRPGAIVELGQRPGDSVALTSNGKVLGEGELVEVGGTLAVLVTHWNWREHN